MRFNGEWLSKLSYAEVVRLARTITVARILERDDFAKRYAAQEPISVSELLYPLMQAYDSVAVESDVELGGTDQLYNLLAGRDVMEAYGLEPQIALTTPLLLSWDGEKMSSSVGNNIPLTAAPEEQFGRTMRIPDSMLEEWYRLVAQRPAPAGDPMEAKLELARFIVTRSHGEEAARQAEEHFTRVVREGKTPEEIPEVALPDGDPVHVPGLLAAAFGVSTSEARRLIAAGRCLAGRRGRRRARSAPGTARTCGSAGRQAPFRPLDTRLTAAIILRLPERVAWRTSPTRSTQTERSETEVEGSVEVGPPVCREAFFMPSW